MQDYIDFGSKKINFHVKRSKRKSLGISVLPTGLVEVTAPEMARMEKIKEVLATHTLGRLSGASPSNGNKETHPF